MLAQKANLKVFELQMQDIMVLNSAALLSIHILYQALHQPFFILTAPCGTFSNGVIIFEVIKWRAQQDY